MLDRLYLLQDYSYYFQFTLTPYDNDIEPNLPSKAEIIDTFLRLADKIGKKRVVWRYDPILLSADVGIEYHLEHFARLAGRLSGHTEKCIISFMDMYRHLQTKLASRSIRPPDEVEIRTLAAKIAAIASANDIKVETCAEAADLADYGIKHGRCIDDRLIAELTGRKMKIEKDKRQRKLCGCVASIDIGEYNTCRHLCNYCYANSSPKTAHKNISLHNDEAPLLIGEPNEKGKITNRKTAPLFRL
jgi:DNA repair photolyase